LFAITNERLTARPEIRIGDRVFGIDTRLSIFEGINRRLREGDAGDFEIIIAGALGEAAYADILAMDLSFGVMRDIVIFILAAIQEISEDEARGRFRPGAAAAGIL